MKHIMIFLIPVFISLGVVNGVEDKKDQQKQVETREITNFTEVFVSQGISLHITQSSHIGLRVEATPEYLNILKTEVVGKTLRIHIDSKKVIKEDIDVYLSYKDINVLTGTSGADIETVNPMNTECLQVYLSSGSDLKMKLDGNELRLNLSSGADAKLFFEGKMVKIDASSASDIKLNAKGLDKISLDLSSASDVWLEGSAAELIVDASSASKLDASDFIAVNAKVQGCSASNLVVTVIEELNARASSFASIKYKGRVENPIVHTSSGGFVFSR